MLIVVFAPELIWQWMQCQQQQQERQTKTKEEISGGQLPRDSACHLCLNGQKENHWKVSFTWFNATPYYQLTLGSGSHFDNWYGSILNNIFHVYFSFAKNVVINAQVTTRAYSRRLHSHLFLFFSADWTPWGRCTGRGRQSWGGWRATSTALEPPWKTWREVPQWSS